MSTGGVPYRAPGKKRHNFAIAPMTPLGKWALGLVATVLVLAVAVVTIVPGDSVAAWLVTFAGLALLLAAGSALFTAIFRRSERAVSVYVAALVLLGGVLFVLLHSLFISD